MSVIQPVQRAQVVRPWLPELLPQFQHFVWLDCDLWVQNGEFMGPMIAGATRRPFGGGGSRQLALSRERSI